MTIAQAIISENSPVAVGLALAVITALVGCAWKLSAKMTEGIAATKQLRTSVDNLSADFNGHITKSDERDAINQREHAALNRCCDSNVLNIDQLVTRMTKVEAQSNLTDKRVDDNSTTLAVHNNRLASLEDGQ